jgi:hypothetical protein
MDMSDDPTLRDFERRLSVSLQSAAPHPAAGLADRCMARTAATAQRRRWSGLAFAPVLAAATVVIVAVVVGLQLGGVLQRIGQLPSPSPAVVGSPAPSPTILPSPTDAATPSPTASPEGNVCENTSIGYAAVYPADWWANEEERFDDPALTDIPACLYFAEEPAELTPNAGLPPSVAISFRLAESPDSRPPSSSAEVISERATTVDGMSATVTEVRYTEGDVFFTAGDRVYTYLIQLEDGRFVEVATDSLRDGDYEAHKEILDEMMRSLQFAG